MQNQSGAAAGADPREAGNGINGTDPTLNVDCFLIASNPMKNRSIKLLTLAATASLFALADQVGAQTQNKESIYNPIQSQEQAQALPEGSRVAMVCAKCKTVQVTTEKKNFLTWFTPKTKHLCPGCGGYWIYTQRSVKGLERAPYAHTCSKCGSDSAFCCSSPPTKTRGMCLLSCSAAV
jgi:hypothetical protein